MNNKETLQALFSVLNGCLPYEYDEKYLNGTHTTDSIIIVKNNSDHIMQITASNLDDDTFTVFSYDDGDDQDKDSEVFQWVLDSPDVTLDTIITDIKNRF